MKAEKISLYDLGKEYERHIKTQDTFIEHCKEEIRKAKESRKSSDDIRELQSKLYKFYEIRRELQEAADALKNYYRRDDSGRFYSPMQGSVNGEQQPIIF